MDRALASLARVSSGWFHLVIDLDAEPDAAALDAAWEWAGRWHPALRARALLEDRRVWDLAPAMEPVMWCTETLPADGPGPGPAEVEAMAGGGDLDGGPVARWSVVRRGGSARLVLSLHHVIADAASGLELADRVRATYVGLLDGRAPSTAIDGRPRIVEDVLERTRLGPMGRAAAVQRHAARWWGLRPSTHPVASDPGVDGGYAVIDVSRVVVASAEARHARGWRVSAVLLGLLARAWRRVLIEGSDTRLGGPDGWQVASDLRRELAVGGGIGNFSSTEPLTLHDPDASVVDVVDEVNRALGGLASTWPGVAIPSAVASTSLPWTTMQTASQRSIAQVLRLRYTRSFSNVGPVSPTLADWGPARGWRVRYAPAMVDPAWVTVVAQGFGADTFLTMRTHASGISEALASRMEAAMVTEAEELSPLTSRRSSV